MEVKSQFNSSKTSDKARQKTRVFIGRTARPELYGLRVSLPSSSITLSTLCAHKSSRTVPFFEDEVIRGHHSLSKLEIVVNLHEGTIGTHQESGHIRNI